MPRRSELDKNPELAASLAGLYVAGKTRSEIGAELGIDRRTVTEWMKDERVAVLIAELSRQRASRLLRKIDTEIENRLNQAHELDVDELVKLRKEILRTTPQKDEDKLDEDLEMWKALDAGDAPAQPALPAPVEAVFEDVTWEEA